MPCAAIGAPYALCIKKVNHRNAPGAISAMALIVRPPKPNVGLVVGFSFVDISFSLSFLAQLFGTTTSERNRTTASTPGSHEQKKSPQPRAGGIEDFAVSACARHRAKL